MVEDLDRSIERILKQLDELKLADKTMVVFTSDNGGLQKIYTGVGETVSTNSPLRDEKGTIYEGGIRVPMIVRWPGVVSPGSVCAEPTTTADLLPTFAQVAKAELPAQPMDGMSLVSLFHEPTSKLDREAIYFHYPHYHHSEPTGAIRSGKWKLIEHFDDGELELYDLKNDLSESHNLIDSEKETAAQLHAKLAKWQTDVNARMPKKNPKFDVTRRSEWWNRRTNKPLDIERMRRQYESRNK